ncbi:uncharacterized protein EV422DRAFT_542429 [Fimicolochytrium jonesii]|uniref:uncharacterized protein n=1 Tax=Fimicolochytrium jonesii TaxID=1396493 RepID=UPI0022FF374B|nr:uncharacterized protein EV422DRAFT_542429 [Fimicolochytrium jonesii]KAI8817329.1 hypothetical protein EV422DRAFT_542429 [Fimicolochytrium jonesii]
MSVAAAVGDTPCIRARMSCSSAFSGGGAMGQLVRAKDWSTTKLGPSQDWAQSLKTSVSFILNAAFPFILFWGDHYNVIYNDQYIPIFGGKHPTVLGQPGYEAWSEVWDVIRPMLENVRGGTATWSENQLLELTRNGYVEECYFTWSYSPVRIEDGTVGGVMTPITETTKTVLSERRLNLLRELAASTANTQSEDEACALSAQIFEQNCADITFALIYMLDGSGRKLILKGFSNVESGHLLCVSSIDREEQGSWPVDQVFSQRCGVEVHELQERFGYITGGVCEHTPTSGAIVLPLEASANQEPIGLVVFGINPRRELDSDYKDFLEMTRTQVATSILRGRSLTEKQHRLQALAEIDRAKSVFFSNISHEYRTPLSLILAPVADLLGDSSLTSQQLDKIRLVERNAQRLHKLVNSVLDFSQLEAGRMEANFRLTNISVVTANAASMFRSAMEKGNLDYTVETPPLGEMVYLDVDMWEKIVLNLLSNAFKYTVQGGVKVRLYKDETAAFLEVEDTGCGVPDNEVDRLFERFHRCHSSSGRSVEGTGIGLSLTHELVKLHGGAITATSTLGVGTKFTVSIPLGKGHISSSQITAQDQLDSTAQSSVGRAFIQESARWITENSSYVGSVNDKPDESFSVGTSANEDALGTGSSDQGPFNDNRLARVVLADDNADMREYVGSLLAKFCIVHVANDGRNAYGAIIDNPPDLILSDVMMPHMNGFELLQKIREHPHLKNIPFVLLSARAGEEAKVEGLQAGADDYMVKPFSAKELRARVRAHIAIGRMRKELDRLVKARTAQLQESARQFQLLSNISPVGISRLNMKGEVVFVNKAWWKIVGRDPNVDDPNDWQQWVKPETIADVNDLMSDGVKEAGATARRETTLVRPDGTEVTIISSCIFDDGSGEDGQPHEFTGGETDLEAYSKNAGFYFAAMDITEEKKLEQQRINALLELSEEQRRRAEDADENRRQQEAFVDTICHEIRNPLSGVRNCADLLQLGVKRLWSITRTVQSAVNAWKSMSGAEYAGPANAFNGKKKWSAPVDMNDFMRYLDACVIPAIKNQLLEDHEAIDAISMCTNHQEVITNDVLQLSKLKQHDMPYNPVICAPEVVISRVMRMFRSLMRKKRIEFGWHLSIKTEGQAVEKTYSEFRNVVDAELVFSEPDRLAQIMFNLVTNAIKFTEKSTNEKRITIAVELTNSVIEEEVDAATAGPRKQRITDIKVSVKDTGIGISDVEQQKLFQRFSQASVKTHSTYGGSGLGLSICRQLIDMMGGQIGLSSAANAGTDVFFNLRCKRPAEQEMREFLSGVAESEVAESLSASSSSTASSLTCSSLDHERDSLMLASAANHTPNGASTSASQPSIADMLAPPISNGAEWLGKPPAPAPCDQPKRPTRQRKDLRLDELKVLIVEDNMINQKVLRKQLDKEGVTTEVANNGQEAIEQFMKGNFNVIIMDVEMPLMNGLEATGHIRALEESNASAVKVPILGLSGNARDVFRERAISAGMNRYLVKPYSKVVLFENLVELANSPPSM